MPESTQGHREWLLTDGTGAFALGCADRILRRKYHSLLSIADGLIADRETGAYCGKNLILDLCEDISLIDPVSHVGNQKSTKRESIKEFKQKSFDVSPWPKWSYVFQFAGECEIQVEKEFTPYESSSWSPVEAGFRLSYLFRVPKKAGEFDIRFSPRLLSRPIHELMKVNSKLNGKCTRTSEKTWEFHLYPNDPQVAFSFHGPELQVSFEPKQDWETIEYPWELDRGYEFIESCFRPGEFIVKWDGKSDLKLNIILGYHRTASTGISVPNRQKPHREYSESCRKYIAETLGNRIHAVESESKNKLSQLSDVLKTAVLSFAADIEGPDNGSSPTILAGLPWFGPWARDLFVCMPGYAIATSSCSDFPYLIMATTGKNFLDSMSNESRSSVMNFHGADTPWLYLWAVENLSRQEALTKVQERVLIELGAEIADAVLGGAQRGIHVEPNGGIIIDHGPFAATWMDALIGGIPVTPRHGYPIEINALMINGLGYLTEKLESHRALGRFHESYEASKKRFPEMFFPKDRTILKDLHRENISSDIPSIRPNCLWALALPRIVIPDDLARATLKRVRDHLVIPAGIRSLSPTDPNYHGHCSGNQESRDRAYHQGTAWPWLFGIYADSLIRYEGTDVFLKEFEPIWNHLEYHLFNEGCMGQCSEIFDGNAPFVARGAPAQAWSVCEHLRVVKRGIDLNAQSKIQMKGVK